MTGAITVDTDVRYATVEKQELFLDVYRPDGTGDTPAVIYLHGGGWQVGDKAEDAEHRLAGLARHGVAVVSANYRLVPAATYPAQIHDAKAVVRWVRAHGAGYGLATQRIGIWGVSAGAYLATMVALTNGDKEFEGEVGDDAGESSEVQAAVHWFGQTDLRRNARRSWLERKILNPPFEQPFLGVDDLEAETALAHAASPLTHVTPSAPPFLITHGDQDRVTPASESAALHDALVRAGVESTFQLLGGAGHEGAEFDRDSHLALTAAFLRAHLARKAG